MKLPSIQETSFSCPHCGVLTSQTWLSPYAEMLGKDKTPHFPNAASIERIKNNAKLSTTERDELIRWVKKMREYRVSANEVDAVYIHHKLDNLSASVCYACNDVSLWVGDRLIYPANLLSVSPNPDLPPEITTTFNEARRIANESPRGAAALLRLCVQLLCAHLGEKGKKIDDDIASLVKKGLSPIVQKSLDIVRVIGNDAVHPGTIDLNDDRETALSLFDLINSIAEQMISHPKKVESLYSKLPEGKRKAIEKRDGRSP